MATTITGQIIVVKPSDETHGDVNVAYLLGQAAGDSTGTHVTELMQNDTYEDTVS